MKRRGNARPGTCQNRTGRAPSFKLTNRTGYETADLREIVARALRACGIRKPKEVLFVVSPIRTRGCAEVTRDRSGGKMVIAISSPSKLGKDPLRRLARVIEHEMQHLLGTEHDAMRDERLLYSEGPTPWWARGARLRHRKRAPRQF